MRCKHYWCIHSYVVGFVEWSTDKIHLPIEYWSNDWGNIPSKDHCFQQVLTTTIIYIVPINNRGHILIRWDTIILIFYQIFPEHYRFATKCDNRQWISPMYYYFAKTQSTKGFLHPSTISIQWISSRTYRCRLR